MGHKYGDSKKYYDAIAMMDTQVGKIWNAIQYRKKHFNEDWLIFITTDHGRDEQTGKGHGGQTPRQRSTWMVTNYPDLNNYARFYHPGIVDIMPTIALFMNISIPEEKSREIDGTPLIGKVSVTDMRLNHFQNNLDVSWKALNGEGKAKIWVATTNNFKEGKPDQYKLMGEVPVKNEHIVLNVGDVKSTFYKVVIEAPYNTVNKWFVEKEEK